MTMLTTVLAMVPLAIGMGEGAELQAPMATVIVFGLTFSTIWGYDYDGDERTVDVHIKRLREQLGSFPDLTITTVRG